MCFNANVSLSTFVFGVLSGMVLITKGNPKYKHENTVYGIYLILLIFVQLMEYILWIDLDNRRGWNKTVGIIGPFIWLQPVFLFVIKTLYYGIIDTKLGAINAGYIGLFIYYYITYLKKGNLLTRVKNKRLNWPFLKNKTVLSCFYHIVLILNLFWGGAMTATRFTVFFTVITYIFYAISVYYFRYTIAEMWCFFSAGLPFLMLVIGYFL